MISGRCVTYFSLFVLIGTAYSIDLITKENIEIYDTTIEVLKFPCINEKDTFFIVRGTPGNQRIFLKGKSGELFSYILKTKTLRKLGKIQSKEKYLGELINIGDTLIIAVGPLYIHICNIKTGKDTRLAFPGEIQITSVDIQDTTLLISGQIQKFFYNKSFAVLDSYKVFADTIYRICGVYFGPDTNKWGKVLFYHSDIGYYNLCLDSFGIGNRGSSCFTNDGRILTYDTWTGEVFELNMFGQVIFRYPPIPGVDFCVSGPIKEPICHKEDTIGKKCWWSWGRGAFLIKPANVLMIIRLNPYRFPAFLDLYDISKRKYIGSVDIGASVPLGVCENLIWLADSAKNGKIFVRCCEIEGYRPQDTLENLSEICIVDPIEMERKNLTAFLPFPLNDTVMVINSSYDDGLGANLEFFLERKYSVLRIITESSREELIWLKNATNSFPKSSGRYTRLYNLDPKIANLPYLIFAKPDGTIIKKLNIQEAREFLRKL